MQKFVFILTFLFIHYGVVFCQAEISTTDENNVSKATYQDIIKGLEYNKTKKALRPREFEPVEVEETKKHDPSASWLNALSLFQILAYAAILLIVIYILFVIFSNIKIDRNKEVVEIILDEKEEDIREMDLISELDQALADENYRLAVRLQFLTILKSLSLDRLIKWKPEKTNRDYTRELRHKDFYPEFKQLARLYEIIWYGNTNISSDEYNVLVPSFENFRKYSTAVV